MPAPQLIEFTANNPFQVPIPANAPVCTGTEHTELLAAFDTSIRGSVRVAGTWYGGSADGNGIKVEVVDFGANVLVCDQNRNVKQIGRSAWEYTNVPLKKIPSADSRARDAPVSFAGGGWPIPQAILDILVGEEILGIWCQDTGEWAEWFQVPSNGGSSGWCGYIADTRQNEGYQGFPTGGESDNLGISAGGHCYGAPFISNDDFAYAKERNDAGDFANAYIRHTIGLEVKNHDPNKWKYPATRTDWTGGPGDNPSCAHVPDHGKVTAYGSGGCPLMGGVFSGDGDAPAMPFHMGQIIFFDGADDPQTMTFGGGLSATDLAWARIWYRTMQKHGGMVLDWTRARFAIVGENGATAYTGSGNNGYVPVGKAFVHALNNSKVKFLNTGRNREADFGETRAQSLAAQPGVYRPVATTGLNWIFNGATKTDWLNTGNAAQSSSNVFTSTHYINDVVDTTGSLNSGETAIEFSSDQAQKHTYDGGVVYHTRVKLQTNPLFGKDGGVETPINGVYRKGWIGALFRFQTYLPNAGQTQPGWAQVMHMYGEPFSRSQAWGIGALPWTTDRKIAFEMAGEPPSQPYSNPWSQTFTLGQYFPVLVRFDLDDDNTGGIWIYSAPNMTTPMTLVYSSTSLLTAHVVEQNLNRFVLCSYRAVSMNSGAIVGPAIMKHSAARAGAWRDDTSLSAIMAYLTNDDGSIDTPPNPLTDVSLTAVDGGIRITASPSGALDLHATPYNIYKASSRTAGTGVLVGSYATLPQTIDPGDGSWYFYVRVRDAALNESEEPTPNAWIKGASFPNATGGGGTTTLYLLGATETFEDNTIGPGVSATGTVALQTVSGTVRARMNTVNQQMWLTGSMGTGVTNWDFVWELGDVTLGSGGIWHARVYRGAYVGSVQSYLQWGTSWSLSEAGQTPTTVAIDLAKQKFGRIAKRGTTLTWWFSADGITWGNGVNNALETAAKTATMVGDYTAPIQPTFQIDNLGSPAGYVEVQSINSASSGTTSVPAVVSIAGTETITTAAGPSFTFGVETGGSAITDLEYQLDGGAWVDTAALTTRQLTLAAQAAGARTIAFRAVNAVGTSTARSWSYDVSGSSIILGPYWGILA